MFKVELAYQPGSSGGVVFKSRSELVGLFIQTGIRCAFLVLLLVLVLSFLPLSSRNNLTCDQFGLIGSIGLTTLSQSTLNQFKGRQRERERID